MKFNPKPNTWEMVIIRGGLGLLGRKYAVDTAPLAGAIASGNVKVVGDALRGYRKSTG